MKWFHYAALFLLGLGIALAASRWITVPGYMDAEYYYGGGVRLAQGHGLTELVLWNYLDDPQGLPQPSHTYWMPLASLLAALGLSLAGPGFEAARLPFILLAACLPPLTAWLAYSLIGSTGAAILAGLLAAFPGYYLPYLVTTETFGIYMLAGSLIILLAWLPGRERFPGWPRFMTLGLLAGAMHLSRADGLLWVAAVMGVAAWQAVASRRSQPRWLLRALCWLSAAAAGYLLVTSFWYYRNLTVFHSLLPPGNSRALWLLDYDQTFSFPAEQLSFQRWLAAGFAVLLRMRWDALVANLKTFTGVQTSVVLLPLVLAGMWRLRRDARVRFALVMGLATLAFMTLVFPLAGSRGGFFHSGAAFQPLLWAVVPAGFDAFIETGVRWRNWQTIRANRGFGAMLVGLMALITLAIFYQLVIGGSFASPAWGNSAQSYRAAEDFLVKQGAEPGASVLVNNPPGYFAATGRPALVIPYGDEDTLLQAARQFSVDYIVLETNHVRGLDALYQNPQSRTDLAYLGSLGSAQFYRVRSQP